MLFLTEKKRSRPTKRRHVEESSSSSETSSEDIELDLSDSSEEETTTTKEECALPNIDLWVPTQTNTQESNKGRYQTPSLFFPASAKPSSSEVPSTMSDGDKDRVANQSAKLSTLLRGIARPHSTDIVVRNPAEVISKVNPEILSPFSMGLEFRSEVTGKCSCCSEGQTMANLFRAAWPLSHCAIGGCCWKLSCKLNRNI